MFVSTLLVAALSPAPATAGEEVSAALRAALEQAHAADRFHGAVLVEDGGRRLLGEVRVGGAAAGQEFDLDATFRIASLTKLFTQAAVLRLVDRGEVDLDDTLGMYRDLASTEIAETVTLRHCLTFTSGLPRELTDDSATSGVEFDAEGMAGPFLDGLELELAFEPGSQRAYSNVGYWMLGAVLEAVTGETYAGALRQLVLEPLELAHTGVGPPRDGLAVVPGQRRGDDGVVTLVEDYPVVQRYSSGAMYSSPADMATFLRSLGGEDLLSADSREVMFGLFGRRDGPPVLRANGHVPGFGHMTLLAPDQGRLLILLGSLDVTSPRPLMELQGAILGALDSA